MPLDPKCLMLAAWAALSAVPVQAARNLITNFDHRERMGIDLPWGWVKHIKDKVTTKIDDDEAQTWRRLTEGPWACGFSLAVDENMVNQKAYAVICCVADRDDVLAKAKGADTRGTKSPLAFSVRLEGATEFQNLRYETVSAYRPKVGMRLLRYVFRADSDKARLVFTDRKDDGSAAPDGFKQSLNYISFMPYYIESPDEPAEIAAALGWKDSNRVRAGR